MARKIPKRSKQTARPAKTAARAEEHIHRVISKTLPPSLPPTLPAINRPEAVFPVVGVGASAGGLEAFTAFLKHLPADSGMAYVLIQHLDPKQPSQLTEILSKATRMPVLEVGVDTPLQANHVYVMAPGVFLSLSDGCLRAEAREAGLNLPVDHFLRSLAEDRSSQAIGIVLSGTASDGTLGLKTIKAEGGLTFAQEPSSAKCDGMPRSAIAAGVVDFVLAPDEIAKRLVRLARHPYVALASGQAGEAALDTEGALNTIFHLLRTVTGNDFTHYKHTTIRRRLQRRMALHGSDKPGDYVEYLQENPAEVRALSDDLLICVTSFFRDPEALEALATRVFPEILKKNAPGDSIRIWVPGCATGEEAYSLAIRVTEFLERSGANVPIQIFASDINEAALEKARAGTYDMASTAAVSPERLKRFFVNVNGGHQILKSIRENCIFARQNITKDPPFHNLDLITCCNVLIYFGPVLQRKALSTFHYALKPTGFLMLGPSESIGPLSAAFSLLDNKLKLYVKEPGADPLHGQFLASESLTAVARGRESTSDSNVRVALDVQKTAERMLLAQYAPVCVIVDDALNIVHVRGDTGPYLQLASGEPTYNLLKLAREGLVIGLRTAFLKARQKKAAVTQQACVKHRGQRRDVTLRVVPVNGSVPAGALHFMVLFEDVAPAATPGSAVAAERKKAAAKPLKTTEGLSDRENARLEQELAATQEYLQSIIEEQEASSEELKSANEEGQATNEELETAKEELQSANEELNTLNDELKTRNVALTEVNADLSNVLTSINVPLVMVGKDLKIRRFTAAIEPMLNLLESDIGRPIADLNPTIDVPDLSKLLRGAVNGESSGAREIQSPQGRWYSLRVLPYRMPDQTIDGALLVLHDIDAVKHGRDYAEAVVETVRHPLLVLSKELSIMRANEAFYETFKVAKEATENQFIYDLGNGKWNIPRLREALEKIPPGNSRFEEFEIEHKFPGIGRKVMVFCAREIQQPPPYGQSILLAIEDVTESRRAHEQLTRANEDLTHFAYTASHDLQEPLRMVTSYTQLLAREYKGKLGQEADQFIAYVVDGAQRMEALLKGLREFWQAGECGEERREDVDCNAVLEQTLRNLQESITKSGAVVTHDSLPAVWAEEVALVQLLQNLIGNAIKYRSEEPPKIHLSAGKNDKGEWVFSVKDNGIGIDPQYAEKIFDMFYRLHGTKYPGTGIGLALCRKVVERLGGRIWVESKPGQGSDFKFTIPSKE
jgi:two-component system CheB/CheR fusion protein